MKPILLNTGLFIKQGDINKAIEDVSTHDVDGIELGTSFLDVLMDFRLSQQSFTIIKKWKTIGMNAPSKFYYRNDRYTRTVLSKLKTVYELVNAKYAVFHAHTIEDFSYLEELASLEQPLILCLENDRNIYATNAGRIKEILEEHPFMKFVLNTTHALSLSEEELSDLISLLKDRIVAVHLSGHTSGEDHTPLHLADERTLALLDPVRSLEVPFVLEIWHTYKETIDKEISFVRGWLNQE
jgi:hypothetical protein